LNSNTTVDGAKTLVAVAAYTIDTRTKIASAWAGAVIAGSKDGSAPSNQIYTAPTPNASTAILNEVGGGAPGPNSLIYAITLNTASPSSVGSITPL
jgi:hypothetical protein